MADLVPAEDIERIVGAKRHPTRHLARFVSKDVRVYILHSQECLDSGIDLRQCEFSLALDRGVSGHWVSDEPVRVFLSRRSGLRAVSLALPPVNRLLGSTLDGEPPEPLT